MNKIPLFFVVFLSACNTHVKLASPPEKDAPFELRLKAYKELRPVETTTYYLDGSYQNTAMVLGNGIIVRHAEDLIPVVGNNLKFSNHVQQAKEQLKLSNTLLYVGAIAALTGLTMFTAGFPVGSRDIGVLGWSGLGVGLCGLGVELAGVFIGFSGHRSEQAAFSLYGSALQERLGLEDELNIKDSK